MKFTPYPEDVEVVHSFDDLPAEEYDGSEDGDDNLTSSEAPNLAGRLLDKIGRKR